MKVQVGWIQICSNIYIDLTLIILIQFVSGNFKEYEMRLISYLSSNQKANLENDYEENQFFKFNEMYPGHQFACVEKLKKCQVPMLYYNDKIPDVELCKLGKAFGENDIDATTTNIQNEYATKMLLLFFPF